MKNDDSPIRRVQFSPTCKWIWVRVLPWEELGSWQNFFLWIHGEDEELIRSSVQGLCVPGCGGSHSSSIADKVSGWWRLLQLCGAG
ncbi:hypothetical protein F2Q68_00018349 [Brassica cretica]|uniref:Uncharacterized protein n=1 Tax=Brassica cretica TaxID=69181 RepID=A0A8S9HUE6_BRACR|nr:hypothetical protein F2Q68_00018349 [Brassica cretica]